VRPRDLLPTGPVDRTYRVLAGEEGSPAVDLEAEGWSATTGPDVDVDVVVVSVGARGGVADALSVLTDLRPSAVLVVSDQPSNDRAVEHAVVHLAAEGWAVSRVEDTDGPLLSAVLLTPADTDPMEGAKDLAERARAELEARREDDGTSLSVAALHRRLKAAERSRARESERAAALAQDLRVATRELALERRRLTDIERSTSYTLGQALVQSARDPRQVPRRSRELLDRWRKRGRDPAERATTPATEAASALVDRTPIPITVPAVAAPRPAVAVAGVVTERTAQALQDEVLLTRLLPHDAAQLVAATVPTVVLIESEACAEGQPWTGAGSGAVPARDRDLAELLRAADQVGAATVLVWSGPRWRAPGLRAIAERCTLEVAGDDAGFGYTLGVPPARVARDDAPSDDGTLAALDLRGDLRLRSTDPVERWCPELGGPVVTDPWGVWSRRGRWLIPTTGPDRWQAVAAAVAGAVPVTADEVGDDLARLGVRRLDEGVGARLTWEQRRRAVLDGGTAATLRTLGELLGRDLLPVPARAVAVHLATADDRHVDALLAQTALPPGSVIVTPTPPPDRAVAALEALGHRVSDVESSGVRFAVVLDADRHARDHLADLLAGWELSRAAVVGPGGGDRPRVGTVGDVDVRDRLVDRHVTDAAFAELDEAAPAYLVPAEVPA
jgi:hypothetical protein